MTPPPPMGSVQGTTFAAEVATPSWWRSYVTMLRWNLLAMRIWLPMMAVVQLLVGVGFIIGISFLFEDFGQRSALYVSTGAPVMNLLMIGLVLGPQLVADQKLDGSYDYLRTMPTRQSASAAAWYTVCLVGGVPAMVVSLIIGWLYHDLTLQVSPTIVPAVILSSMTATMLGYAISHAIANPMTTKLLTQLLVFAVLGFTPIFFAVDQLPGWLATLNWWLPFQHMAVILRAALTEGPHVGLTASYLVLVAWTAVTAAISARALGHRS